MADLPSRQGHQEEAHGVVTQSSDTSPEAEWVQIEIMRRMPTWQRLQIMESLITATRALALQGLAQRYPGESSEQLRRRLVELLYGVDLAQKAYGPQQE
jgi:hypothetical protein